MLVTATLKDFGAQPVPLIRDQLIKSKSNVLIKGRVSSSVLVGI